MYVEGNPVHRVDPTGHNWQPPDWCQAMPTKGLYEYCILQRYKLEPISIFEMGKTVKGQPGCYSGPTEYRAPGYLEGSEKHWLGMLPFLGVTGGKEVVYDFATMQRSKFSFVGGTVSDGLAGVGAALYVGKVLGFRTDKSINEGYRGESFSGQVGISFDVILGGAIGRGVFVSESDIRLRGKTLYLAGSISGDFVEGIDLSGSWVNYEPTTNDPVSYDVDGDGIVEGKAKLYSDISSGIGSPWAGPGLFSPFRIYGRYLAEKYVAAYEELRNENQ